MRFIFFLLLSCQLSQTYVSSQNNDSWTIEYLQSGILLMTDYNGRLSLNSSSSKYLMYPKRILKDSLQLDTENLKFNIKIRSKEAPFFLKDFAKNTIYSNEQVLTKPFIVKDNIPKISWQIYDEQKTIANTYVCKKAIGEFRGRTYTVWFTEQIPISNGPWKLGGLPGLILEAYDEKKEVVFEFVSLRQSNDNKDFIKEIENIDTKKTISWEDYAKLFRKKIKQFTPAMQSQLSGDVTVSLTNIKLIEKSILEDEN